MSSYRKLIWSHCLQIATFKGLLGAAMKSTLASSSPKGTGTGARLLNFMQLWILTWLPLVSEVAEIYSTPPPWILGFESIHTGLTQLGNLNWFITSSGCLFEQVPDKEFKWPGNVILVNEKCKHLGLWLCWMGLKMSYSRYWARSLSLVWQSLLLPGTCSSRLNMILCNTSKMSITPSLVGLQL